MNAWYESAFGELYPVVYGHRDAEEARRAVRTLDRRLGGALHAGTVLDVACGEGRYLRALAEAGVTDVVGVDLSPTLLALARRADARARLVRADMRALPLADACAATVLSMFTSFGYFDDAGNARVLAEMARVCRPLGRLVLDFLDAERVPRADRRTERVEGGWHIVEARRIEGGAVVKDVRARGPGGRMVTWTERVRLYDVRELTERVRAAGFAVEDVWGDYDGAPRTARTSRVIVVGRRAP